MRGKRILAALACVTMLSACRGGAVSNGLMEGASPETSALGLYIYDGEAVTGMHVFEDVQEILDRLDAVPAAPAEDWSLAEITTPIYALEMGTTDGLGISAAWSNGYWITPEGEAYRFDFDMSALAQDYAWSEPNVFPDFSVLPCARALSEDENGWSTALLTAAEEPHAPTGVRMALERWDGDGVTVRITNESGEEWMYGEYYALQVRLDDVWYSVPPAPGNWGFNDIGLIVSDGETQEKQYSLTMYGELPAGSYRLVAYGLAVEGVVQ